MPAGRRRTINKRPPEGSGHEPIKLDLGHLLDAFPEGMELTLDNFTAKVIIRIEVITVEVELKFHPPKDLSEEIPNEAESED